MYMYICIYIFMSFISLSNNYIIEYTYTWTVYSTIRIWKTLISLSWMNLFLMKKATYLASLRKKMMKILIISMTLMTRKYLKSLCSLLNLLLLVCLRKGYSFNRNIQWMNKSRWKKKVWTLLKLKRTFNMILICKKDLNSF